MEGRLISRQLLTELVIFMRFFMNIRSKISRRIVNVALRMFGDAQLYSSPGHFYSPIVDYAQAFEYITKYGAHDSRIELPVVDKEAMRATLHEIAPYLASTMTFLKCGPRYRESSIYFNLGEACVYAALIGRLRPRLIIEVGSGFSSACALDAADHYNLPTRMVFIDPHPDRLHDLLLRSDHRRVTIYETSVQDVDLEIFDDLGENDILFLDTTHVVKTGSDVVHELFEILPRLKSGVTIHFHDIFDGWEYPREWVQQARSWNEIYALRAFLMHNTNYRIRYFNDFVQQNLRTELAHTAIGALSDFGSGIYLTKL